MKDNGDFIRINNNKEYELCYLMRKSSNKEEWLALQLQ